MILKYSLLRSKGYIVYLRECGKHQQRRIFYQLQNYYGSFMENNWRGELLLMLQTEFQIQKAFDYFSDLKIKGISQAELREYLSLLRDEIIQKKEKA